MKKTFAFLSAVLMIPSCAGLSASAYTTQEVVIAVNDDASQWVTQNKYAFSPNLHNPDLPREVNCRYMSSNKIASFNPAQETFEFGDIIQFENVIRTSEADDIETITEDLYFWEVGEEDQPYSISKVGSVFDNPETKQFTITRVSKGQRTYFLCLRDDDGNHYQHKCDWRYYHYYQPDCVDIFDLHTGDVINCITYNDIPMIFKEITSAAPPSGDVNGDGTLDILDVIMVNKAILGKEIIVQPDQIYHADLNQNGVPDAVDSLIMLKMIVELE